MRRKWMAFLLALAMVVGLVPQVALAQANVEESEPALEADVISEEEDQVAEELPEEEMLVEEDADWVDLEELAEEEEELAEPASAGFAYVSIEKFTIGQGYLREPVKVEIVEGDTAATVMARVLGEGAYRYGGTLEDGFYITGIADPGGSGTAVFPDFITNAPGAPAPGSRQESGWLQAMDFSPQGGWMLAQNHAFGMTGMSDTPVENGDVLRMQFSVYEWGSDLGNPPWGGGDPAVTVANRDALIKKMVHIREDAGYPTNAVWQSAYAHALQVTARLDATAADITSALAAFDGVKPGDNIPPTLKDGVEPVEKRSVLKNGAFRQDLSAIFEDMNDDKLSYEVSVDGAGAVAASKSYVFTPRANNHTLVFRATDGKDLSKDSYTVNLYRMNETLKAPTNIKATSHGFGDVSVSFTMPKNADRYRLYAAVDDGKFELISQNDASGGGVVTVSKTGLIAGEKHSFKVFATKMVDGDELRGDTSRTVSATNTPARATAFTVRRGAGKNLWLNWNKTPNATGYLVYRSESRNGRYSLQAMLRNPNTTSYVDRKTVGGVQYFYKLIPYQRNIAGQNMWGRTSGPRSGTARTVLVAG